MQALPPQKSWLANYGVGIELSPRWSLHAEDSSGTTLIPNASYLAFANKLQDIGWKQTVSRLSFTNSDIFVGDLLVGLGEGERLESDDGDLYLGARFKWYWQKALSLQLAYSEDQNSLPKDAVWWLDDRAEAHKGFHNQRLAASLALNGQLSGFRGLEASLGWQRTRIDRSDDRRLSTPTNLALDPTEILSQDLGSESGRMVSERLIVTVGVSCLNPIRSAMIVCTKIFTSSKGKTFVKKACASFKLESTGIGESIG
ncbi:MAG: hypothetical protein EOP07_18735 [Proteobacteria bacterium]|nr:MAG: hypothetical protein EOP07_18735 [Pseudomonadota bacterium]